jgi:hypothetical protein
MIRGPNSSPTQSAQKFLSLIERGCFRLVLREDISSDPKVIPFRFVLSIKEKSARNCSKRVFCYGWPPLPRKRKPRAHHNHAEAELCELLLAVAAIFGFEVMAADVVQAYF